MPMTAKDMVILKREWLRGSQAGIHLSQSNEEPKDRQDDGRPDASQRPADGNRESDT